MNLPYKPALPAKCFPILIIGTGGIVKDAHLPAYRTAGFPVWGLYNRTRDRAAAVVHDRGVPDFVRAVAHDPVFDHVNPYFGAGEGFAIKRERAAD